MITDHLILIINISCITFLMLMMAVMMVATRMKGGAGWAALVIASTTIPVYLANMSRDLNLDIYEWSLFPAIFLNAICFPAMWFLVRSQFDKSFRFTWRDLPHLIPAIVSLVTHIIYYAPLSAGQLETERIFMEAGGENLPAIINDVILFGQFFIYFIALFFYIRKRRKYLQDNYSDSDYMKTRWIPGFLWVFFVLFFIVVVAYVINPRTDAWLIPILNTISMAYLVYNFIFHSVTAYINRLPDTPANADERENAVSPLAMSEGQMKEICDRVTKYLLNTGAYKKNDLNLTTLSVETGIHPKNISAAINGYLHKNFFELINGMRVKEAKRLLLGLSASDYTIESIYNGCGFRSRSTFFMTFKKFEGVSPAQWLKGVEN